jgi:SAM-dependent methyltransferase
MRFSEDAYGIAKRFAFCEEIIASLRPAFVLDLGCGTGENLTRPLAERFPGVRFLGIDDDPESVVQAKAGPALPNLSFGGPEAFKEARRAELVIASEVIEHVESPERFLAVACEHLSPDGRVVVTLPNGYGPFEIVSLLEVLLRLTGAFSVLRRVKRSLAGGGESAPARGTLAASPHISFFSYGDILKVFARSGLEVERYRARTLLCGFGLDVLVRALGLERWNARVADALPRRWVSGWMFALRPASPREAAPYHRGPVTRWRRSLNERCWGTGASGGSA